MCVCVCVAVNLQDSAFVTIYFAKYVCDVWVFEYVLACCVESLSLRTRIMKHRQRLEQHLPALDERQRNLELGSVRPTRTIKTTKLRTTTKKDRNNDSFIIF